MKQIFFIIFILILSGLFSLLHAENLYQWVDDNGVKHFSNDPKKIDGNANVKVIKGDMPSCYRSDKKRIMNTQITNNVQGLDKHLINKNAIYFNQQIDELNRIHNQNIINLQSDLNKKNLDLENAKKGIQKIDYSKTNWRMIKRWNDDHEKEIKSCEREIKKTEDAISSEKRNYIAEKIIIEETFRP